MFTGLIEETSKVLNFSKNSLGAVIEIDCSFSSEMQIGDSVSINGACLTVVKINGNKASFEISNETLAVANFSEKIIGQEVNVERAMKAVSRFDGHIVSGHIDGVAKIKNIKKDGFSYNFEFEANQEILKYVVKKGSVAINGISLTVCEVTDKSFTVEVIPHTINMTNLLKAKENDIVNIETDIVARYIERFLSLNKEKSGISMEMLRDNGYL